MEHVDVYRVEKRGRGPFADDPQFMDSSLPTPDCDAGLPSMTEDEIERFRFGAPCIKSMRNWIEDSSGLTKRGYKVSLYKAKKKYVHSSEIQSMFIKRHAKKVKEWTVEEFMKESI